MIYIAVALYAEAKPFIQHLELKKEVACTKFQLFRNDSIFLIITKTGKLNAAIALTYLFSHYEPTNSDLLINIGVCGCTNPSIPIGMLYFCHSITDNEIKRTFYPDLLYKHNWNEAHLETYSFVANKRECSSNSTLIDMEASGLFIAASYFLQPHQMLFLKVVSDHLQTEQISSDIITSCISPYVSDTLLFAMQIEKTLERNILSFDQEELDLIEKLVIYLHLSVTMKGQLKQVLLYYKIKHVTIVPILLEFIKEIGIIQCKTKSEGKYYFEQLKSRLI